MTRSEDGFRRRLEAAIGSCEPSVSPERCAAEIARRMAAGTGSNASPTTIRSWLRKGRVPNRRKAEDLAAVLGVSPAWLILGEGPMRVQDVPERAVPALPSLSGNDPSWGLPPSGPKGREMAARWLAMSLSMSGVSACAQDRSIAIELSEGVTVRCDVAIAIRGGALLYDPAPGRSLVVVVAGKGRDGRVRAPMLAAITASTAFPEGSEISVSADGTFLTIRGRAIMVSQDLSQIISSI